MWFIEQLLAFWRERLAQARELAQEPTGTPWLWRARERIFRFLIARYGDEASAHPAPPLSPRMRAHAIVFDVEPVDAPPRARHDLAALFASIRRTNEEARRRLRWRWW